MITEDDVIAAKQRIHDAVQKEASILCRDADSATAWLSHWVLMAEWAVDSMPNPVITMSSPPGTNTIVQNGLLHEALYNWTEAD